MSTLDKLKQSLNFTGSAKGLENINSAAKNVNMAGLGKAVEDVRMRFSALEVMGVTALANITNSAVNAGKRMVSALTIDPIKTGLQEYETQINAVQTILANTESKGTTIDDVNQALKELNEYADLTIYNFTEMTRNIGTFTAAGVDLNTSVQAIQGIANLAAVSGSTSQQASTAMYQLSQALASGTVKLMDWNSVVNAGMGGEVFQNALKETARIHGVAIDKMIEDEGSFRETLKDGWLTSEILTETLSKFTMATENLTEAEIEANRVKLRAMGYTDKQIEGIFKLGNTATNAATKVKTFTQLWDVMKESAQSGWAQTWKLIIGDFEEAKNLLSPLADFFTGVINKMSEARNKLLESALGKSFTELSKKISGIVEPIKGTADSVSKVVESVKDYDKVVAEIIGGDWGNGQSRWDKLTKAGYDWAHAQNLVNEELGCSVRHATTYNETQKKTSETQTELNETTAKRIAQLSKMSDAELKSLGYEKEQIQAFRELKEAADKLGLSLEDFLLNINEIDGRWLLINTFKNIGQSLVTIFKSIGEAWRSVFNPVTSDQLFNIIAGIHRFSTYLVITDDTAANLKDTFAGLFAILDIVSTLVGGPIRIAFKIFEEILKAMDLNILDVTAAMGRAIVKFSDWVDKTIESSGIFEKIADYIIAAADAIRDWISAVKESEFVQKFIDGIKNGAQGVKDAIASIGDIIGGWKESIKKSEFFQAGKDIVQGLIDGIKNRASSAWDTIVNFAKSLITKFCSILGIESPSTVFFAIGGFIIAGLVGGLTDGFSSVTDFFKNLGSTIVEMFKNFDWNEITASLRAVAGLFPAAKFLNIFANFTYLAHVAGDNLIAAFNDIGGRIPEGLANGIKGGIGGVWDAVVSFAKTIIEKVCDILGIHSPSTVMIAIGGFLVLGLIMGLKNGASSLWDVLKNGGSKCIEIIQTFAEKIIEIVKAIDLETIISVGMATGLLVTINKIAKVADKFATPVENIGKLFENIKDTVAGVGKAIKTHIKVKSVQVVANAVLQLAFAIGVLAASLWLISKVDPDRLWESFGALAALSGIVVGLVAAVGALMAIAKKIDGFDSFAKIAIIIVSVSASLLILAGAIKMLSTIDANKTKDTLWMLAGVVASMVVVVLALSKLGKTGTGSVAKVGSMMLGVSAALLIMVGVVKIASKLEPDEALKGLAFILAVELLFIALIRVSKVAGDNAAKAGGMILLMSIAFAAMIGVVKMAAKLDPKTVEQGLGVVLSIGILFAALIAVSESAGENGNKAGIMLLGMSVALGAAIIVIKLAGQLTDEELKNGLIVVAVLETFFIALIAVSELAGEHADKAGKMLISMSAALLILTGVIFLITLLTNDMESLRQAVVVVAILEALMAGLIAVTYLAKDVKTGPLIMIALAISILSGVLIALSVINPEGLAAATVSISVIMGMLGALIASTNKVGDVKIGTLVKLLGVIVVLSAIIAGLAALEVEGSLSAATSIGILLAAMAASLMMLDHVKSISIDAMASMYGLIIVVGALASIIYLLSDMPSPANTIPIVISIGVLLNAMAASLMILDHVNSISLSAIGAMAGLTAIVAALAVILDYMSNMESPEASIPVAIGIGVLLTALSTSVLILSKVGIGASAAMSAIPTVLALVVAIAAVITALGLLSKIPGFDEVIRDGGALLGQIGIAIGEFIGGIAEGILGGIAAGIMSQMPAIGTYLSDFMTNVTPFVEGIKAVDKSVLTGAGCLAGAVAALAIADFINGCTSILPFGSSLPQLGNDLSAFIQNAMPFIVMSKQIDSSVCDSVKTLAEAMIILTAADLINGIGVFRLISGGTSLADFGKELAAFGPSLAVFADSVSGLDDGALKAMKVSAEACKALAEMAEALPTSGGLIGKIFGENDVDTFGMQLEAFGKSLVAYGKSVEGIDKYIDCIAESVKAGKSLSELADSIPDSGGFITEFFGDNTIDTFGIQLEAFGKSIVAYGKSVEGIDKYIDAIASSVEAGASLAEIADAIPNSGGFIADFFGDNSIDDFGIKLSAFGDGLSAYGESVLNISDYTEGIDASIGVIDSVIEIANKIRDELDFDFGESEITKLGTGLQELASGISQFSTTMAAVGDLSTANTLVINAVDMANYVKDNLAWDAGKAEIVKLGQNLAAFGSSIAMYYTYISSVGAISNDAAKSAVDMANYVKNNLTWDAGEAEITKLGKDIESFGKSIASYGQSLASMGDISNSSATVDTLISLANKVKANLATGDNDTSITNFGKEIAKFGKHIAAFAASISEIGDISVATSVIDGLIAAYNKAKTAFASSEEGSAKNPFSSISKFSKAIEDVAGALGKVDISEAASFTSAVTSIASSAKTLSGINLDGFTNLGKNLEAIGKTGVNKFVKAFSDSDTKVKTAISTMIKKMVSAIKSEQKTFKEQGVTIVKAFVTGIKDTSKNAKEAVTTMVSEAAEKAGSSSAYDGFYSAGSYCVDGFAAGISDNDYKAAAKAAAMAEAALQAAKEELDINSPSKVFRSIGKSVPEGFAMGISMLSNEVAGSAKNMAKTAIRGTSDAISRIADAVNSDIDAQPTIRPVLDLSDVTAGADTIGSLFNNRPSVGVTSNIRAINSMMNNQNGGNDDVVSAINKLRKDLGNVGNTYNSINGITYDDEGVVSDAIETIVRAARRERRV
jgi:tape measure domain-containing protein